MAIENVAGPGVPSFIQRTGIFAEAADPTNYLHSLLHRTSLTRVVMMLQAIAIPFAFWVKPACLLIATTWYARFITDARGNHLPH